MKNFFQIFKIEKNKASILTWSAVVIVAISFCFGWDYALVSLFSVILTFLHSRRLYKEGCLDNVADEYEHIDGGYPEDGWKKLQRGLKTLSVAMLILGVCLSIIFSFTPMQNACLDVHFGNTYYSVPYPSVILFLLSIILLFLLA